MIGSVVQAQNKNRFNQPLADSLESWAEVDQFVSMNAFPTGKFKHLNQRQWEKYKGNVYSIHKKLLQHIFKKYDYPGYDQVGEKGADNFWVMVQHCDNDPGFQQSVLVAMKAEVYKGNAKGKNYAYLMDRVKINTKKKQVYGTQITYDINTEQAIPMPLEDSLNVNQRRKEMGMKPIEEYLNFITEMHFNMNKESFDKNGIHQPKSLKVPE